ncbi:MAG: tetratricopeptide repeat protein [Verrucomicrobia bacterium]|nr:tetratricopeptide repeat protein [Verrucomicrobiota bacterium]
MKKPFFLRLSAAVTTALASLQFVVGAAEPAAPAAAVPASAAPAVPTPSVAATNAEAPPLPPELTQMLRDLHEQQRANARQMELLREQAAAARQQGEIAGARLKIIEYTLTEARQAELAALRNDNRHTLGVIAAVASVGVAGVFVLAIFLFRSLQRLGGASGQLALASGGEMVSRGVILTGEAGEQQMRVFGVMDQLEKRVKELESTLDRRALPASTPPPKPVAVASPKNGAEKISETDADEIVTLMAKGQTLLNAGNASEALDCFDSVLRFDAHNTDALIKQGKALEKLRRFDEALESFDRALATDGSLTVAYLSKGGVLNRLERFDEALQCYEQALRTQQHGEGGTVTGPIVVRE